MTIDFLQAANNPNTLTTYTFSGQNLGNAAQDRYIIISIAARKAGIPGEILSVSVAGITANILGQVPITSDGNNSLSSMAIVLVPNGVTGDVVVTMTQAFARCGIGLYRATGITGVPYSVIRSVASNPTGRLSVMKNGFVIGISVGGNNSAASWSGITEDFDVAISAFTSYTGAHLSFTAQQLDLAITCTWAVAAQSTGLFISFAPILTNKVQKHFYYKIYDDNIYVTTWTEEVISEPQFRSTINGGAGELTISLARLFDDFGEDDDVKLNNRVECYVVDKDNPSGLLLYAGYISGYRPIITKEAERVEITVLSFLTELQRMILTDGSGNTTLTYNSYDPSDILRDVITKYRARGGQILYTTASIRNTNTTVSYTFQANTVKEALDKIIELAPVGWYWRVDPDGVIYFANKNVFADHTFTLGLDVENLETFRRIEDVINRVLFVGAGSPALYREYENTGSQDSYGLYEEKIVDQRVSVVATAAIIANREIDSKKDPEIRSIFTIIDNNGPRPRGYNIESVKPGQTLKVKGLRASTRTISLWDVALWDQDVWDQTLTTSAADVIQILAVDYSADSIRIEASSRLPQIAKRIEDVQRNLEVTQSQDIPSAPS